MTAYPEDIRDPFELVPAGNILFTIDSVKAGTQSVTRGNAAVEKKTENVHLTVMAPESHAGIAWTKTIWIGSDDDPAALQAETLKTGGASKLKSLAAKAGVDIRGKDEELVRSELQDRKVGGSITHKAKADGFVRADANVWWAEGERVPVVDEDAIKRARDAADAMATVGGNSSTAARPVVAAGAPPPPRTANR